MEEMRVIAALAATASTRAGDSYARGVIDGIALVIGVLDEEGALREHMPAEWLADVRNFIALEQEHRT